MQRSVTMNRRDEEERVIGNPFNNDACVHPCLLVSIIAITVMCEGKQLCGWKKNGGRGSAVAVQFMLLVS